MSNAGRGTSAVIGAILLAVLSIFCIWRFEITTEITHFLPTGSDRTLAGLTRAIADSDLTRTMILSVAAKDGESATAAAAALAARLDGHAEIAWIRNSSDVSAEQQEAIFELYHPRRMWLLSDEPESLLAEDLTEQGLARMALNLKRELTLPTGPLISKLAPGDPFLAFPRQLQRLRQFQGPELGSVNGRFVSHDGRHGIIFLGTRSSAFDSGSQMPLLEEIKRSFAEIAGRREGPLSLEMSGMNRFAVSSENSIRQDIARISIVSIGGAVLLFLLLFRSPRFIVLLLIPLVAGMVAGLSSCLLLFGRVHGITLAFGASVIGVCVDYPIHFFNHHTLHPDPAGPVATLDRIWGGLRLGALTTIAGLAGMAWTTFPGIREVAIFAPAGILGALLTTKYLLPALVPRTVAPGVLQRRLADALSGMVERLERRKGSLAAILALALLIGAVGLAVSRWNDDLASMNSIDPALMLEDARVRAQVSSLESGRFIISMGADRETALRRNDVVFARLEQARADGLLGGMRSLHSLIWSRDLQERNRAVLSAAPALIDNLESAFTDNGFRPGAFDPFFTLLRGEPASYLTLDDLLLSPLADAVRPLLLTIPPEGDVGILTLIRDVRDSGALARSLEGLEGVTYFDQSSELRRVYRVFRTRTQQVIAVGLIAVLALIYARYRRPRYVLAAFLPALLAAGGALGLQALLGVQLNLLSLIGTLLVLSMGVDYGIFLLESRRQAVARSASLLSIMIASMTTVLSFGLMGLSRNPGLRGIGLTAGIGSLLSLLLVPIALALLESRRDKE